MPTCPVARRHLFLVCRTATQTPGSTPGFSGIGRRSHPYGVSMRQPSHPTHHGARPPGLAWLASLVAHTTVVLAVVWASQPRTEPPSLGRRLGALMVRIESLAHTQAPTRPEPSVRTAIRPDPTAGHVAPESPPPAVPQEAPPAQPTEVTSESPTEARTTPPPAVTPPQQTPPGTTWTGLFAPLISKPLGRGRWGGMAPPPPPTQQDPALQQAQALQARRAALMQRLQTLGTLLAQTPLQGECQVELALASPHGQVSCPSANDANLVRSVLNDFLPSAQEPATPPPPTESICLHLIQARLDWVACQPTTPQ